MSDNKERDEFFGEGAASAAPDALASVKKLTAEAADVMRAIDDLEEAAKASKARLHHIRSTLLPDICAEAGVPGIKLEDGTELNIEDFVSGSLPKDPEKRKEALDEVIKCGGKELITSDLGISFTKTQHNEALSLVDELSQRGFGVDFKEGVHPQSLLKFVREKLKAGEEIDTARMGVFNARIAKIKIPKWKG
jgi:hypothetical protein